MPVENFKIYRHAPEEPAAPPVAKVRKTRISTLPFLLTFCPCMLTWVILSGQFDAFHLSLGVLSSAIVAYSSGRLLFPTVNSGKLLGCWGRFIRYIPWLIVQVLIANLHMLKLVFHPNMLNMINPRIVRFESRLESTMARFVLANSITLTPGTITVFASIFGSFTVHVIDDKSGRGLPGKMEDRVAEIYGE